MSIEGFNGGGGENSDGNNASAWDVVAQEKAREEERATTIDEDFAGETNTRINSKGERVRRTYSEFDVYPRMKGETSKAYGERLRRMHELTARYQEELNTESDTTRESTNASEYERLVAEERERMAAEATEEARAEAREHKDEDELDREEAKEYEGESELDRKRTELDQAIKERDNAAADLNNAIRERAELGETAEMNELERKQAELKQAIKERADAKADLDSVIKRRAELDGQEQNGDEPDKTIIDTVPPVNTPPNNGEKPVAEDDGKPLVAVNVDFTHDAEEIAHDLAEQDLNAEVANARGIKAFITRIWKGTIITRIWKGTINKKYYEMKYQREYLEGTRKNADGKSVTDIVRDRSEYVTKSFVLGAVEGVGALHKAAGEKLEEADGETTKKVRAAIEAYAAAPDGTDEKELRAKFEEALGRSSAEARDNGQAINERVLDNYLKVAEQAREKVVHGLALERVMDGFKVYNAEARSGVRTEAHRDRIDRITSWFEGSKYGKYLPPEIIAGALGIVLGLTQTGARAVGGVAGGIAASGVISGLKERNRVTEDRTRLMRDMANGLEYGNSKDDRLGGKTSKYEAKIGGTAYNMVSANALTDQLDAALSMEAGKDRDEAILKAMAAARVRIDFSDQESKDLICYSSEDKRGDERLKLDIAMIEAEKSLSPEMKKRYEEMQTLIREQINSDVDKQDAKFKQTRRNLALKKAGVTVLTGVATYFTSQEVMAALDPGKVGILEKVGILKTNNNEDASETLLASGLKINGRQVVEVHTTDPVRVEGDDTTTIEQLKANGYDQTEVSGGWTETKTSIADVDPASSSARINVKYDGWANNGTKVSDGNELRAVLNSDGQMVSMMSGNSTVNGQVLNYDSLAAAGQIKGYITIGGSKFEIASTLNDAGQLTWGENGVFTTTTGETIKAIGDAGEKLYQYFEIAVDNGVDANGLQHIIPMATDVGQNSFNGTIQQVVDTIVEHPPVYQFTKTTETMRQILTDTRGVPLPFTSRTGLGGTRPVTPESVSRSESAPVSGGESAPVSGQNSGQESNSGQQEPETQESSASVPENFSAAGQRYFETVSSSSLPQNIRGVLLNQRAYDEAEAPRMNAIWNSLSREQREIVMNLSRGVDDNEVPFGRAFRGWINSLNNNQESQQNAA